MASLNRIILIGRLTADPENRSTVEGTAVSRFRLAVDRPPREGQSTGADFIDVVAWDKLAEVASKYLKKGQMVLVEGRIQVRSFLDDGGNRKWSTEVVARILKMLSAGKTAAESKPADPEDIGLPAAAEVAEADDFEASDLPF